MGSGFDNSLTKISASPESSYFTGLNLSTRLRHDESLPVSQNGALPDAQESQPYRVTISEEALRKAGLLKNEPPNGKSGAPAENDSTENKSSNASNSQEILELENLKRRDREVRAHEQAHVIAGGSLVRGAASFGYATGPDGRLYAVSGEVSIDASPVQDDPEATSQKMGRVSQAALAPAQPSGQDRAVAAAATKMEAEARQQITQQQLEKMQGGATQPEETTPNTGQPVDLHQTISQNKHINIQA